METDPLLAGPSRARQWVYLITYVSAFSEGYDMGVLSGVLVLINGHFDLTPWQVAAFMGCQAMAIGLGGVVGGLVGDCVGRVRSLIISNALMALAAVAMALAESFPMLLATRCAVGFGIGMGLCIETVYINECSSASHRGRNGSLVELLLNLGILGGYAANYVLHRTDDDWRWMLAAGSVLPAFALTILLCGLCPESPRFLMLQGRLDEAKRVLSDLVGKHESDDTVAKWKGERESVEGWSGVFATPSRRKMAAASIGAGVLQLASGISIVSVLSGHILTMLMSKDTSFASTFVMGGIKTSLIAVVNFYLIDRVGRRPLLLASAAALCVSAVWLGAAFDARAADQVQFALCTFAAAFSIGLGPVVYVYSPEVLENSVRAAGMSVMFLISRCTVALILTLVPLYIGEDLGKVASVWYFFAAVNGVGALFIYAFCPETKRLVLEGVKDAFA